MIFHRGEEKEAVTATLRRRPLYSAHPPFPPADTLSVIKETTSLVTTFETNQLLAPPPPSLFLQQFDRHLARTTRAKILSAKKKVPGLSTFQQQVYGLQGP